MKEERAVLAEEASSEPTGKERASRESRTVVGAVRPRWSAARRDALSAPPDATPPLERSSERDDDASEGPRASGRRVVRRGGSGEGGGGA